MASLSAQAQNEPPAVVAWEEPLPKTPTSISVFSYNVLLPNSEKGDGWWMYKMYSPMGPAVSEEETSWPHRASLLKRQIEAADADVVCLQECSERTFTEDFAFMEELGYLNSELFKKGRFRPATFWRPSRVSLVGAPSHRDRVLATAFSPAGRGTSEDLPQVFVLNCHLTAGPEAPRRLRQMAEAVDFVRKDLNKRTEAAKATAAASAKAAAKAAASAAKAAKAAAAASSGGDSPPAVPVPVPVPVPGLPPGVVVVVAGDMNAEAARPSGVAALMGGCCPATLLEDGVQVTSKDKAQGLAVFSDPYQEAYAEAEPPPTMVCEELIPRLLAQGEEENGALHPAAVGTVRAAFEVGRRKTWGCVWRSLSGGLCLWLLTFSVFLLIVSSLLPGCRAWRGRAVCAGWL